MEYLLGSVVTLVTLLAIGYLLRKYSLAKNEYEITYSQSYVHSIMAPLTAFLSLGDSSTQAETQSLKHYDSMFTQVVVTKNKAYWIKDNTFLVAPINEDGEIDREAATAVDTMSMSKVQLEEISLIVEELTRGKGYDSGSAGKS